MICDGKDGREGVQGGILWKIARGKPLSATRVSFLSVKMFALPLHFIFTLFLRRHFTKRRVPPSEKAPRSFLTTTTHHSLIGEFLHERVRLPPPHFSFLFISPVHSCHCLALCFFSPHSLYKHRLRCPFWGGLFCTPKRGEPILFYLIKYNSRDFEILRELKACMKKMENSRNRNTNVAKI